MACKVGANKRTNFPFWISSILITSFNLVSEFTKYDVICDKVSKTTVLIQLNLILVHGQHKRYQFAVFSIFSRPILVEEPNSFKDDILLIEFPELDLCNSTVGLFEGVIDEYGNWTAEPIIIGLPEDDILNMACISVQEVGSASTVQEADVLEMAATTVQKVNATVGKDNALEEAVIPVPEVTVIPVPEVRSTIEEGSISEEAVSLVLNVDDYESVTERSSWRASLEPPHKVKSIYKILNEHHYYSHKQFSYSKIKSKSGQYMPSVITHSMWRVSKT